MFTRFVATAVLCVVLPSLVTAQSLGESRSAAQPPDGRTAPPSSTDWSISVPVYFGDWTDGYETSWVVGGGVARAISERLAVQADFSFARWGSGLLSDGRIEPSSLFFVNGSIISQFRVNNPKVTPFVGGGLVVGRAYHGGFIGTPRPGQVTSPSFPGFSDRIVTGQAQGGIEYKLTNRIAVRGEGRLILFAMDDTLASLAIIGGVSLCPTCR